MVVDVQAPDFLVSALDHLQREPPSDRPHVTLTFAQSLDAKIAGYRGKQLILSGKESMIMTHWMRTMHDGIMVGIGTALNDDPQLNARLLAPRSDGEKHSLPRPIVLDCHLRLSPHCKLLKNYRAKVGRRPWVICASPVTEDRDQWQQRFSLLTDAGANIVQIPSVEKIDFLSIAVVLQKLRNLGIRSLMVEGGAQVIQSFISASVSAPLLDNIITTVAPVLVGEGSVEYGKALKSVPSLQHQSTHVVGRDSVIILRYVKE